MTELGSGFIFFAEAHLFRITNSFRNMKAALLGRLFYWEFGVNIPKLDISECLILGCEFRLLDIGEY